MSNLFGKRCLTGLKLLKLYDLGDPSRIATILHKSSTCPNQLTNLLASRHAGMFQLSKKLQTWNPDYRLNIATNDAMPLGDSEMAAGAF